VLIFNRRIYSNAVPDHPGGGTILYSNPWRAREYVADIESREDGGTPPVLQGIKAAMCVRLKEKMGVENIIQREEELLKMIFSRLSEMANIHILQGNVKKRLGIISFLVKDAHYNLIVKLLNDRFGIQTRGGCSCAGTYGHRLLNVDEALSQKIRDAIHSGDLSSKPGWIRLSIHPTMTDDEVKFIMDAIASTASNFREWMADYDYDTSSNEYTIKERAEKKHPWGGPVQAWVSSWYS
jgi:selenocysteine lyase/cysteine desulfurase